jgi:multicomponent Na+:H+ antiporter subunit D
MVLAPLVVLVPILAATLLAAASPFAQRGAGLVAVAAALGAAVLTALVLGSSGERGVTWFSGWHPRGGAAIGIDFAPGRIGAGLALFVAVLAVVALIAASRLITVKSLAFDALVLIFVAAMLGFAYSGDLFNLFVFFELMSVTAYVLVGYEVGQRVSLEGSLTFAITNSVGSFLLLFGIGLLYGSSGALNLAQIGRALEHGPVDTAVVVAFALIASGLLVKAAVVPFHLWTADAYAVAPTPVCILLAGAFSELGLFGLFRIYWTAFHGVLGPDDDALRVVLVTAGSLTGVLGAVMCALQHHLKRMLAFATIAQVGLFLLGLALLTADGVAGAAVWVVGDGLVKAALFVIVAIVQHRYDRVTEGALHGRARGLWPLGLLFALGALTIASLPPTGSFLGRSLVEDAALKEPGYAWVPALMALVTALVAGTLLRAGVRVFAGWGAPAGDDPLATDDDDETEDERGAPPRSRFILWALATVLLAAAVGWGVVPGLIEAAGRAAGEFTGTQAYAAAVLDGAHRAIAVPELKSPSATGYLYAAASVAGALAVAGAGLAGVGGRMPRGVIAARERLRGLHNGHPTDYVAWLAAGAAVLCGCLALVLQ